MSEPLFRLGGTVEHDPVVEAWFDARPGELGEIARRWFAVARRCGDDVREVLHDDQPTACVGDTAFVYVDAFTAHVNVGFFRGAELPDPAGLLEGSGKRMRHVKLRPSLEVDRRALSELIHVAYRDIRRRLEGVAGRART